MKCPICDIEMRTSFREEVEIDHCPQCRGIWLDRGELEKILAQIVIQYSSDREDEKKHEREAQGKYEKAPIQNGRNDDSRNERNERYERYERDEGDERNERNEKGERGGQKREGFFANLMDLFGGD
jgi:Zn-finger nucleic acid-binding protein